MRVKITRAFVGRVDGHVYRPTVGQEMEMPEGADWITAGFAIPVETEGKTTAMMGTVETAAKAKAKPRSRKKGTDK